MNTKVDPTTNSAPIDSAVSPPLPRDHLVPISKQGLEGLRYTLYETLAARLPELNESLRKIADEHDKIIAQHG